MMNKIHINSQWMTVSFVSTLLNKILYIQDWVNILRKKLDKDKLKIQKYENDEYGEAYTNLVSFYNPLYAGLLITIYSSLEYDICVLFSLEKFNFNDFRSQLENRDIDIKKLKYFEDINILRLCFNAYKHNNGFVTKKLENKINNNSHNEIEYISMNIIEYYEKACRFLFDIYEKINKC